MVLQVLDLIGQQEGVGHESVVDRKEALQPRNDDAENVFLREMLQTR